MRLSLSAWSRVGFAGSVKDTEFKEAERRRDEWASARDHTRREPGAAERVHCFDRRSPPPAAKRRLRRGVSLARLARRMTSPYQTEFIDLCMRTGVLKFGKFTLKSGRESPYFFNAGLFSSGAAIAAVGRAYGDAIVASDITFDMLFGPAYKGIPLVTAAAASLAERHGINVPFAFNRKESKDHGEGGSIVGATLAGRVLIVDDVITAGTAIRESVEIIRAAGAHPAGVLLALDRQERGSTSPLSAVEEVREQFGIPVLAVIGLTDLMQHMSAQGRFAELGAMQSYRDRYGLTV